MAIRSGNEDMLAHTLQDDNTSVSLAVNERNADVSHKQTHSITNATSFDELDLDHIVEPHMLAPRIPYPADTIKPSGNVPPLVLSRGRPWPSNRPTLHVRSRSLGSVLAPWPSSPPQSPLPPIPAASDVHPFEVPSESHCHTPRAEVVDSRHLKVGTGFKRVYPDTGTSPGSFISMSSATDSQDSEHSEDSDAFYTAPVSPVSFMAPEKPLLLFEPRYRRLRPYKHTRQSSSTSTIRTHTVVNTVFYRGADEEISSFSDSDDDGEPLPTPTDPLPGRAKHKRSSSLFKIIDRLKYGSDTRK